MSEQERIELEELAERAEAIGCSVEELIEDEYMDSLGQEW